MPEQGTENKRFVLDANVFLEYIFNRKLRDIAIELISQAIKEKYELIIPSLALDEISEVLCGNINHIDKISTHLKFLERLIYEGFLKVVIPNSKVRLQAIKMARQGHKKSGYPEFTDCLYHSLAILNDAVFITIDRKHFAKVKHSGNIVLLSELPRHLF